MSVLVTLPASFCTGHGSSTNTSWMNRLTSGGPRRVTKLGFCPEAGKEAAAGILVSICLFLPEGGRVM